MLQESVDLINTIIEIGTISSADFNLLQFNLARVYGKTSDIVIEQCRHNLLVKLARQRAVVKQTNLTDLERNSLLSIPDAELGKLIISQTFQFTPSARTKSEHKLILNKHNDTLTDQRRKLREFSRRLHKAAQISRARTRVRVRLQVEKIRINQKTRHERIKADLFHRYGIDISSSTSNNDGSVLKQSKDTRPINNQFGHEISMTGYQKNLTNRLTHHVHAIEKHIDQKKNMFIAVRKINEQFVHKKFNQEFSLAKYNIFNRKNNFYNEVNAIKSIIMIKMIFYLKLLNY